MAKLWNHTAKINLAVIITCVIIWGSTVGHYSLLDPIVRSKFISLAFDSRRNAILREYLESRGLEGRDLRFFDTFHNDTRQQRGARVVLATIPEFWSDFDMYQRELEKVTKLLREKTGKGCLKTMFGFSDQIIKKLGRHAFDAFNHNPLEWARLADVAARRLRINKQKIRVYGILGRRVQDLTVNQILFLDTISSYYGLALDQFRNNRASDQPGGVDFGSGVTCDPAMRDLIQVLTVSDDKDLFILDRPPVPPDYYDEPYLETKAILRETSYVEKVGDLRLYELQAFRRTVNEQLERIGRDISGEQQLPVPDWFPPLTTRRVVIFFPIIVLIGYILMAFVLWNLLSRAERDPVQTNQFEEEGFATLFVLPHPSPNNRIWLRGLVAVCFYCLPMTLALGLHGAQRSAVQEISNCLPMNTWTLISSYLPDQYFDPRFFAVASIGLIVCVWILVRVLAWRVRQV